MTLDSDTGLFQRAKGLRTPAFLSIKFLMARVPAPGEIVNKLNYLLDCQKFRLKSIDGGVPRLDLVGMFRLVD